MTASSSPGQGTRRAHRPGTPWGPPARQVERLKPSARRSACLQQHWDKALTCWMIACQLVVQRTGTASSCSHRGHRTGRTGPRAGHTALVGIRSRPDPLAVSSGQRLWGIAEAVCSRQALGSLVTWGTGPAEGEAVVELQETWMVLRHPVDQLLAESCSDLGSFVSTLPQHESVSAHQRRQQPIKHGPRQTQV